MSAYTTLFDADTSGLFASSPVAGIFNGNYDLFKQASVALWTSAAAILANGSSTTQQKAAAAAVATSPVSYCLQMMGAFMADPTIQAHILTPPTDAEVQAASDWVITVLS